MQLPCGVQEAWPISKWGSDVVPLHSFPAKVRQHLIHSRRLASVSHDGDVFVLPRLTQQVGRGGCSQATSLGQAAELAAWDSSLGSSLATLSFPLESLVLDGQNLLQPTAVPFLTGKACIEEGGRQFSC